ncbi:chromatin modification- protein eaf6 [Dipsacomyces acuminosporus]|nr:chromatin modification- protein eaf6 [Dipsacomyces acuminosporus]
MGTARPSTAEQETVTENVPATPTTPTANKANPSTDAANNTSNGKNAGDGKEAKVTKKMLKEAEQELFQLLLKKKQLDRSLINTESAIYDFETSYFENSGQDGNIVHGFEGYLTTGRHERRQFHFTDADRIFSQSSATFKKVQEAKIAAALQDSDSDESVASSIPATAQRGRKYGSSGGSTIKHNRHGSSTSVAAGGRSTPTPISRATKKIKLSMDSSN